MDECAICKQSLNGTLPVVELREKGSDGINRASVARNSDIRTVPGQVIHTECRREYIHPRNIQTNTDENNNIPRSLRSTNSFDFNKKCMFCARDAKISNNRKRGYDVYPVRSFDFQETIWKKCTERNDEWAHTVSSRLSSVLDLPAAEAVYHQTCNVNFRTGRLIPKSFQGCDKSIPKLSPVGRPDNSEVIVGFEHVIAYIEDHVEEVVSVQDLVKVMEEKCGEKAYSAKHMKRKLIEYFGNSITISSLEGKVDIITLKETASSIIHSFSRNKQECTEENEKKRIISTAAKLIKTDIGSINSSKTLYPSFASIASLEENLEYVPDSLQLLLSILFASKDNGVKIGAICQAMIQASRPRGLIIPLQIGLGVQLHHHFGSRFLIDTLNNLGFCSSYWEVQKFEMNATTVLNTSIPAFFPGKFLQFVGDNVDHNVRTLDGHNTFHGMGMIACTTPGSTIQVPIPRQDITLEEISTIGKIHIKFFKHPDIDIAPITFKNLDLQNENEATDTKFDMFFKVIWPLVPSRPSRPSWSGFMQLFDKPSQSHYPGKSSISFLPMIDMSPSDLTCIYTTMNFVCELSRRYHVTPVLTFDQPLFQKASYIVHSQQESAWLKNIVLRLGGFHTEMSFLGAIGHIMGGSGLQELLETVYAPNAVTHMLTGKAVSRAIRGHFLVDTALHALLMKETLNIDLSVKQQRPEHLDTEQNEDDQGSEIPASLVMEPEQNEDNQDSDIPASLVKMFDDLKQDCITKDEICQNSILNELSVKISQTKENISTTNRTAGLWLKYMDMICILQKFVRAERVGNWNHHLQAVKAMLPYFAASGHSLYLKSAYIYLQSMIQLEETHPEIHKGFLEGNHVIRRTDRYWAGLSTDLAIEQVLMRSLKTSGGLTRGRGMTETQRTLWLLSMPATAEMNAAMQDFTAINYKTSEQHKEEGKARTTRDEKDVLEFLGFLQNHNPFDDSNTSLRNIETGVTAEQKVNADAAKTIGEGIIQGMIGKSLDEYTFKRSKQVVTLSDKTSIKITGETVSIDPQSLFQRLTTVANRYADNIADIFKYELCSVPSSLFDSTGLLREAQKSLLAEAIWKKGDCSPNDDDLGNTLAAVHVIDGGSLLQKIPWKKEGTFRTICGQYLDYLKQKYTHTVVVFDGYATGATTKDIAHIRRAKGGIGTKVVFSLDTPFKSKKDTFLRNMENKQSFIQIFGDYLIDNGICVRHAESDADCLIVQTAIEYATESKVIVVGEDTDLLVLLCYHANVRANKIYFRSDTRTSIKPNKVWDIHKTKDVLGNEVCYLLPFIHALTGCDTTSRIYGIGKATTLKLLCMKKDFRQNAITFMARTSKEEIIQCGEKAIVQIFDGSLDTGLDVLRFRKFATKVMSSTSCVQVHTLPPTSAAASNHSLRVYLQTQTWIGNESLDPCEWGWQMQNDHLVPIKTCLPPAPEDLLKIIRCNCRNNCDSKICSCRKHGLECSPGCGDCRGVSCSNSIALSDLDIDDNVLS